MGRKLERLLARVSALEEAFTQLLSDNLRHGPLKHSVKAAPKKKVKRLKAKKPQQKKTIAAAKAVKTPPPTPAPLVRPASPTRLADRTTSMPISR